MTGGGNNKCSLGFFLAENIIDEWACRFRAVSGNSWTVRSNGEGAFFF